MRFLVLEDEKVTARGLQSDLEPLGHIVSIAPTVEAAQVALQAERFGAAILSSRLLGSASYSLVDYIRITQPEVRVILVKDTRQPVVSVLASDWVLSAPVSPLEVVQVMEYLMDRSVQAVPKRPRRPFTYAGTGGMAPGPRHSLN